MNKYRSLAAIFCALATLSQANAAEPLSLLDAHIHYSHDAWEQLPPKKAVSILRNAGLKQAFVSSSSDEGTQMLYAAAPDLIVPVLRPYRRRGELSTWLHDDTVPDMLESLLEKGTYAGIGEFHVYGEDVELPVVARVIDLAKQHSIFLHAHSDADAVKRIFAQDPQARVLWAHSGFSQPKQVGEMLKTYPNLWCDLAFRSEHARDGRLDGRWRSLFENYPKRFMIGTDTYTPERWFYVEEHANWSRQWLAELPQELRLNIAWRNADTLAKWALQ